VENTKKTVRFIITSTFTQRNGQRTNTVLKVHPDTCSSEGDVGE